jgi:hypothetical protein
LVTAPLHGFRDTDDYWRQSSSKQWLGHIKVPTLVINARNDPFMPASVLPAPQEVSSSVTLEFPQEGGHAGFMQGLPQDNSVGCQQNTELSSQLSIQ